MGKVGFNDDNAKDISHVVLLLYCCIQLLFLYDLLPPHATIIFSREIFHFLYVIRSSFAFSLLRLLQQEHKR